MTTTIMQKTAWLPLLLLCSWCLSGCPAGSPEITIVDQEAVISPVIVGSASVFMKIVNSGGGDDVLVNAKTDFAGSIVELHDMREGKMVTVDRVPVPGKSEVRLRPASYHLMLFKLPKDIKAGDELTVIMSFEKSGNKTVVMRFSGSERERSNGRRD